MYEIRALCNGARIGVEGNINYVIHVSYVKYCVRKPLEFLRSTFLSVATIFQP